MITFLIGLGILILGAVIYGRVTEKVFKPTDAKTPANVKYDGGPASGRLLEFGQFRDRDGPDPPIADRPG